MTNLLLAGAGGGAVRGLVGYIKYQLVYKNVKFKPIYFFSMIVLSALVGLVITSAIVGSGLRIPFIKRINPSLAFIVGYAGGDFIENLYKILLGKSTLFPTSKK